jgi:hypothetical protein
MLRAVPADVVPESLEVFSHRIGSHALKVVLQKFGQARRLWVRQILGTFQQQPAGAFQDRS